MMTDFTRDKPIYSQLVDRICGEIIKGHLRLGDKLPSVREYAVESGVNVNTVQRVYKELELMQLTETKRGQGTFITMDEARIHQLRDEMKAQLADHFLSSIEALGFSQEEMLQVLQQRGKA
ncbi:GntR family transcriptional regulator [Lysinibacillus louembei]|uniref:GntR family transcriptional regulator n=1 Tax=Lysinibacillus louembei TaxID=1470088 RepID=A0ABZ0S2G7_9BACI|nr:GntR family transcriptional regulator [Lysinibacillus louembei]WPK14005.1 GntR family transcriptional regulator [Lysinibacillus louembei]